MIVIKEKKQCCGCTACESICSHKAITMRTDKMGFLYPFVDSKLCVDCGLCEKVCQFKTDYNRYDNYSSPRVFGCKHKNLSELSVSQSGGASWGIIQKFLEDQGVVYGVGYDTVTHIIHKRATKIEECFEFRGSKYVQSDIRGIFKMVKNDLVKGERVLFFGTSCQVSGLKSYLPDTLHILLLTVDIVCHAVPSPKVWEAYVKYLERKNSSTCINVNFRNKKYGWHSHIETFKFENGKEYISELYKTLFYKHLITRDSCSNCPYTNLNRVSDITISDFWGWENYYNEWTDNKGVSLFLVNSEKGYEFYKSLNKYLSFKESDTQKCLQPQLQHSIIRNKEAYLVEHVFDIFGFKGLFFYISISMLFDKVKFLINNIQYLLIRKKVIIR